MYLPLDLLLDQESKTLNLTWSKRCMVNFSIGGILEEERLVDVAGVLRVLTLVAWRWIKEGSVAD